MPVRMILGNCIRAYAWTTARCPDCGGTGWIDHGCADVRPCETCGNRGIVRVEGGDDGE